MFCVSTDCRPTVETPKRILPSSRKKVSVICWRSALIWPYFTSFPKTPPYSANAWFNMFLNCRDESRCRHGTKHFSISKNNARLFNTAITERRIRNTLVISINLITYETAFSLVVFCGFFLGNIYSTSKVDNICVVKRKKILS